jgi:MtrB/PioB family decaheme-associated outer membrane protein
MKRQVSLVRKCVLSALLGSVAWAVPGMQALAGDLPVKAPPAAEPIPYWWFHGSVEAGGRFFLNDPQRNGFAFLGQQSLAKFYEYRDLRQGPFGNFWLATGSRDGLYEIDAGGKNVGYRDQSYYFEASKAGQYYFNFIWDQTPHVYSTSAVTFYQGLGTGALTLPPGLRGSGGFGNLGFNNLNPGPGQVGIIPFLYQTDIGIRRDTAAATYRWTPTDPWDIRADYSHMSRTGTEVAGIVGFGNIGGGGSSAVQVPKPVDDTTQNYGVNGEYAGTSPWGKKITVKLAYNGSQYTDNLSSYLVQNPYTGAPPATQVQSPFARMSLWPSNQMNSVGGNVSADLGWKSRYAGTLNYTMMRQNDAFQPMSFLAQPNFPPSLIFPLPASSLNGAVNTLLSNNVVTTQITPELTNKASYRYYNYDNNTSQLLFPTWVSLDRRWAPAPAPAGFNNETAIQALVLSYNKQNAGDELVWHPTREWTLGAAYGFERYNWTNYVAAATNENSGKVFADWKPTSWFTLRSSGYFSDRRSVNYDLASFTNNQFPGTVAGNSFKFSPAYRMLMMDNRERWKANVAFDMVVAPGVLITPNFKYQDDNYGLNPANQLGLTDARSWNAGIDLTYVINPRVSITFGYQYEFLTQLVYNMNNTTPTAIPGSAAAPFAQTSDRIVVNTFTGLLRYAVIPDKLDTELRYTASQGVDNQKLFGASTNPALPLFPNCSTGFPVGFNCQFPDVKTWFQRLDATATYTFDKTQVAALGWKGEVKAKLRYSWERNSVNNWQQNPLMPTGNLGEPTLIYLAYYNPNYNVSLLAASLSFIW